MMKYSHDQKKALESLSFWFKEKNRQYITLGGYAGTGKTTLISHLREKFHKVDKKLRVSFCAYTGKAARILRFKLSETKALYPQDFVGTIHSLIYSPITDDKDEIIGWELKEKIETDLIIIDEASMVDGSIWDHLLSFGIPIIAVGDHGQLPPIRGKFNLMEKPELILEEIHRQAKENPIIKLSAMARKDGKIPFGSYGGKVVKINNKETESREFLEDILRNYRPDTLVLCGYNSTRIRLNSFIRSSLGFEQEIPQKGDRVICLRNNHVKEIFNGMLGKIIALEKKNEEWYETEIKMDEEEKFYKGQVFISQFNRKEPMNFTQERHKTKLGDLFDFGYALTVHKAQGSQAKRVVVFEERFPKMDEEEWRRWLYTAVTRAEEELIIVG
ncbi:ATP-dependent RecD-like DNA helicase [Patescibacteria group bacterium]|nr:ATP-dependent RecD-like DNA helicase [Patescibacteria group bacterium]